MGIEQQRKSGQIWWGSNDVMQVTHKEKRNETHLGVEDEKKKKVWWGIMEVLMISC
jgi:hypothetical protein